MLKTYPARFVGEFDRADISFDDIPNPGDVALVKGYPDDADRLWIRCGCGDVDPIPVQPRPNAPDWRFTSRDPVHLEPSVRVGSAGGVICHYFLHGGELQMLDDTTSTLL